MEISLLQYFEFLGLVACLVNLKSLRAFNMGMLAIICLIGFTADMIGALDLEYMGWESNYWVYGLYMLLGLACFSILFNNILHRLGKTWRWLYIGEAICVGMILINYLFIEGPTNFNTNSVNIFCIANVVLSCITLVQLALSDTLKIPMHLHPYFAFCVGTLLFSLGTVVTLGLQRYILANQLKFGNVNIHGPIMLILNIVLYSLYTYAAVLCRMKKNKS